MGVRLEEVYSEFSEKPLASASLGQVHKARLRSTGEVVAVKVQHKWIKEQVPGDLRLIQFASDCAAVIFPDFRYGWLPEEFRTRLPLELDFVLEAGNAERCAEMFKDNKNIAVPKVYREWTAERVLTMSFEAGIPATNVREMHSLGIDLKKCARIISEAFTYMIYEKGFVHSDPHPGNIFVRPKVLADGSKDVEIVLLDHGLYTDLAEETRLSYTKLWRGILTQNERRIKDASKELGADFYELFTAMIVNRTYEDVMDEKNAFKTKSRLGESQDTDAAEAVKDYAIYYHRDIVEILDMIKRELLLILKTNNYLRAIDKRLGNPNNTYNTINEVTWKVFSREIAQINRWDYFKELCHYYLLKLLLRAYFFKIKFLGLFGVKASKDEL